MKLTQKQILDFIPHRDPFVFIDSIQSIPEVDVERDEIGNTVEGRFYVSEKLDFFRGHFPGNPILPGVIQTEMMAQTACFTVYSFKGENRKRIGKLALVGVDRVRFRLPVTPGMELVIRATLIKKRGAIRVHECSVHCEDELVSEAQIMSIIEFL